MTRVHVHVVTEPSNLRRVSLVCPDHGTVGMLAKAGEHPRGVIASLVPRLRAGGCRHVISPYAPQATRP